MFPLATLSVGSDPETAAKLLRAKRKRRQLRVNRERRELNIKRGTLGHGGGGGAFHQATRDNWKLSAQRRGDAAVSLLTGSPSASQPQLSFARYQSDTVDQKAMWSLGRYLTACLGGNATRGRPTYLDFGGSNGGGKASFMSLEGRNKTMSTISTVDETSGNVGSAGKGGRLALAARQVLLGRIANAYLQQQQYQQKQTENTHPVEDMAAQVEVFTDQRGKYIVRPKKNVSVPPPLLAAGEPMRPAPAAKRKAKRSPQPPKQRDNSPKKPSSASPGERRRKPKANLNRTLRPWNDRAGGELDFPVERLRSKAALALAQEAAAVLSRGEARPEASIKIRHVPYNNNEGHPINVAIRLINAFMALTMRARRSSSADNSALAMRISVFFGLGTGKDQLNTTIASRAGKDFISLSARDRLTRILGTVISAENGLRVAPHKSLLGPLYRAYVGPGNNAPLIRAVLKQRPWWMIAKKRDTKDCQLVWSPWRRNRFYEVLRVQDCPAAATVNSAGIKVYNHLQENHCLSDKKEMYYNLRQYYESLGQDPFDTMPVTFHVGGESSERPRFLESFNQFQSVSGQHVWIVKPGENTNRGNGINVCKTLEEINALTQSAKHTFILQKYIEHPLLISRRKFDIRCYSLCTWVNGSFKAYAYEEGYLRTSSAEFSLRTLDNRLVHLTNDAVQIRSDDYGKFEPGNKLSYSDFQRYLDQNYAGLHIDLYRDLVSQMKKQIIDSIRAVAAKIHGDVPCTCMEVLPRFPLMGDRYSATTS